MGGNTEVSFVWVTETGIMGYRNGRRVFKENETS